MLQNWLARHGLGLGVGLGLTAVMIVLHLAGVTESLEYQAYDTYVRYFSRIPACNRIVHIDIDDEAGERVGRWPWARDIQAELIRTLHELGARQIVMDITWNKPKSPFLRTPEMDAYADIEGKIEQIGRLSAANMVYPDLELGEAIKDAGNVYLAMYYADERASAGRSPAATELAARIAVLLRKDFALNEDELAQQLSQKGETVTVKNVEAILAGIKREIALERVRAILKPNSSATFQEVHAAILDTPFEKQTADRADLKAAFHRVISLAALLDKLPAVPETLRGKLPVKQHVQPPIWNVTNGARQVGFVNFGDERVLRDVPLLVEWEGRLVEQLAFVAARDALDIQLEDLSIDDGGNLVIAGRDDRPLMRIQLRDNGTTLLNWHAQRPHAWEKCFQHVPVTRIMQIYSARKAIKENEPLRQETIAEVIRLANGQATYARYCDRYNRMLDHERLARIGDLKGKGDTDEVQSARAEAIRLRRLIEAEQKEAFDFVNEMWTQLKAEPDPGDPEIAKDYQRFQAAHQLIEEKLAKFDRANAKAAAEAQRLIEQLKPIIRDKTCFVGYTATAVADMVTTPAFGRAPGVMIHSNLFNSLVQGRFRTWSRPATQATVIALFGIVVTIVTVTRGPKLALLVVIVTIALSFALNSLAVFGRLDHWLRIVPAVLLTFVAWAMIVLIRYLVTDRQRRRFGKAVAQYVSPAMAQRLAESAEHVDLSPVSGEVTCFFSDLAGFTTISEALGPEGTKTVLNPYLEAMSNVLHRHEALINKFMGDGIFAFFNPPILPCQQHEQAACDAAIESQHALGELIASSANTPLAEYFKKLSMRVGIASGPVFVGDYGSENKLDYTCMGDVVNLAARLESANKQFASAVMIAGATQAAVGDRYVYRHLGSLQVKGQTVGVPVFELLGRPDEVSGEAIEFAEQFSEAVAAYARRDWSHAISRFERCLHFRPHEPGAIRYVEAIRHLEERKPPDDWDGTLELTEK